MAEESKKMQSPPTVISYDMIKSADFRALHVDGVWGGLSPNADYINATVFTERIPLPRQVTYKVSGTEVTNEEVSRVSRAGVVRELQAELVMDIKVAESFGRWLLNQVETASSIKKLTESGKNPRSSES